MENSLLWLDPCGGGGLPQKSDQGCESNFERNPSRYKNLFCGHGHIFVLLKEAQGSFLGLRVEVLKLQFRIQDKLRSPSYYIIISTYDQS